MKSLIYVILFLISTVLIAEENKEPTLIAKVKYNNQIADVKFMLKHPFDKKINSLNFNDVKKKFITYVNVEVSDKPVFNVSTSYYFARDLFIKYKLKNTKPVDFAKYTFIDNFDTQEEFIVNMKEKGTTRAVGKIINSQTANAFKLRKTKPNIWKEVSIVKAIFELYGDIGKPIRDKIKISGPEKTYCNEMQIHISSDLDLESFIVLNDKRTDPTIAVFSLEKGTVIDFKFNVNLFIYCTDYSIVVVGKDRDGNFYRSSIQGRIACADACGGGG